MSGEHPFDASVGSVSLPLPSGDLGVERLTVGDAAVEALAPQGADLYLDHVEPGSVLWGVMELDAAHDAVRLWRRVGLVELPRGMGRQVVEHDTDLDGLRV